MSYRDDFLKVMDGQKPKDFPLTEFMGFWPETEALYNKGNLAQHFNLAPKDNLYADFNFVPLFEEKIISETDTHITKIDALGVTCVLEKGTSAMPHYIEFPIKSREDYLALKPRLDPMTESRVLPHGHEYYEELKKRGNLIELVSRGPFAFLRDFIKFDELMMMFYDSPEFVLEMTMNHADFLIKLWGRVLDNYVPDIVYLGEDMAYKNGSMISPAMIETFIYPAWVKIIEFLNSRGVTRIILDSDGNTMDIIPIAIKAGFTAILPLERAANMDGEVVRQLYPKLCLIGGVNKLEIGKGKKEIDAEVEKATRLYKTGRYIPSFDHSVPPIVSYENYCYYLESLSKKIKCEN